MTPFILRITLAILLYYIGYKSITEKRIGFASYFEARAYPLAKLLPWLWSAISILIALFLSLGFMTQVSALLSVYVLLNMMLIENRPEKIFSISPRLYLVMMLIATALLFSGGGAFSIDAYL